MPGIDKAAFLKKIGTAAPTGYGDSVPGAPPDEMDAPEEGDGELSCGAQLKAAIDSGDTNAIDDALREAVAKYGK